MTPPLKGKKASHDVVTLPWEALRGTRSQVIKLGRAYRFQRGTFGQRSKASLLAVIYPNGIVGLCRQASRHTIIDIDGRGCLPSSSTSMGPCVCQCKINPPILDSHTN